MLRSASGRDDRVVRVLAFLCAFVGFGANARAEQQPAQKPPGHAAPAQPADTYRPFLSAHKWGWQLQVPVLLAGRAEGVSSFRVDRTGNKFQSGLALSPLVRVGARLGTIKPLGGVVVISGEYEQDLPTGTWTSDKPISGSGMPNSQSIQTQLRKAWGLVALGRYLHFGGGFMTSNWGMGLVANDGEHGWTPGSARFTDPRNGDLVLRGFVGTGPLTAANITATIAIDKVRSDDVLLAGDTAHEYIAEMLVGEGLPEQGGFFIVRRSQKAADGSTLDVTVLDPAGKVAINLSPAKLTLQAEGAVVVGNTTFGATPDVPVSNVHQLGGALRAGLAFHRAGGVLDLVYASGDQRLHDANLRAFHADPEFETGLLLFRYVQAAQTARGVATASNPMIVAQPPGGIDRLPTRGGMTNAVVVFPRLWVRPLHGMETYGGVLFAFAPAQNIDPFNTDITGGTPRNALGGVPGSYWGTEVDLGLRYHVYFHGTELGTGVEGGVLFPGSALRDAAGNNPSNVYGGRLLLSYRL